MGKNGPRLFAPSHSIRAVGAGGGFMMCYQAEFLLNARRSAAPTIPVRPPDALSLRLRARHP